MPPSRPCGAGLLLAETIRLDPSWLSPDPVTTAWMEGVVLDLKRGSGRGSSESEKWGPLAMSYSPWSSSGAQITGHPHAFATAGAVGVHRVSFPIRGRGVPPRFCDVRDEREVF